MKSAFFCRASSMTSSVRSLVRKSVFTVWGGLGSTSNPTLSQLSANERDAKSFKDERRAFRSMKEREDLQIHDWARCTLVGTRCADDSIRKPGRRVPVAEALSVYHFRSALKLLALWKELGRSGPVRSASDSRPLCEVGRNWSCAFCFPLQAAV